MSVAVMTLVWNSQLPPNWKLVLLAYADHANDDGTSVYPGEGLMVEKTSYSAGTVRRITAELVEAGLLERVKSGYRGQRAEFTVVVPNLKGYQDERLSKGAHLDAKGAHLGEERRASGDEKPLTGDTPNVIEPSVEPSEPSLARRDFLWEAVVAVHGEPATRDERGKYNKQMSKLREAGVVADEYPMLVKAFVTKHRGDIQPTVATIASRVGELRHYIHYGPVEPVTRQSQTLETTRRALENR